jgi:hypothetical protein
MHTERDEKMQEHIRPKTEHRRRRWWVVAFSDPCQPFAPKTPFIGTARWERTRSSHDRFFLIRLHGITPQNGTLRLAQSRLPCGKSRLSGPNESGAQNALLGPKNTGFGASQRTLFCAYVILFL